MFFPNADVVIHPALLVFLGLIVGMLGGFFGVGGGFLITGGLLVFGVPPVYAVGTGLTLVMGTSIINTFKHRSLGNVDFKLGGLMVTGTIPAIFLAEWVNASLEAAGIAGPVIRYIYVGFLASLGSFILYDFWRTRMQSGRHSGAGEEITTAALTQRVRSLRIPPHRVGIPRLGFFSKYMVALLLLFVPAPLRPMVRPLVEEGVSTYVSLPVSGIERISVFVPVSIGFGIGFIAGLLGAGGGFILMPVLIFVLGVPTTVAIGTDLFQIIITGSVGELCICPVGPGGPADGGTDAGGSVHRVAVGRECHPEGGRVAHPVSLRVADHDGCRGGGAGGGVTGSARRRECCRTPRRWCCWAAAAGCASRCW